MSRAGGDKEKLSNGVLLQAQAYFSSLTPNTDCKGRPKQIGFSSWLFHGQNLRRLLMFPAKLGSSLLNVSNYKQLKVNTI